MELGEVNKSKNTIVNKFLVIIIGIVAIVLFTIGVLLIYRKKVVAPELKMSDSQNSPKLSEEKLENNITKDNHLQKITPQTQMQNTINNLSYKLPGESTLVALYGLPDLPKLGSLGEQPLDNSVARVKSLAKEYEASSSKPIVPTFEIITTVASASPTANNDYSNEIDIAKIKPWIDKAKQENIYVLLDLQPGLSDFLNQAKLYRELLLEPHVGLALDPEWRLKPGQTHMKQIGSVDASEINQTATWLDNLIKENNLPNKVFLIHQFKLAMIENRQLLVNEQTNKLNWVIQMDGLGNQQVKQETWRTIQSGLHQNIMLGWKNFIDEDKPMLSPEQTLAIEPKPVYISYQ